MVKHTQTIRRQQPTNCLSVFDHFVKLTLKGLIAKSQQWKYQNNVWNLLKVNSKNTKTTSMLSFWVFIANITQISYTVMVCPLFYLNNQCQLGRKMYDQSMEVFKVNNKESRVTSINTIVPSLLLLWNTFNFFY